MDNKAYSTIDLKTMTEEKNTYETIGTKTKIGTVQNKKIACDMKTTFLIVITIIATVLLAVSIYIAFVVTDLQPAPARSLLTTGSQYPDVSQTTIGPRTSGGDHTPLPGIQVTDISHNTTTDPNLWTPTSRRDDHAAMVPDDWSQRSAASGVLGSPTAEYPGVSSVGECLEVSGCVSDPDRYPWRCQTVHYEAGLCRVFPVSLALDPISDASGYWTRTLSAQNWIPVFRVRSGTFVDPYLSWMSNNTDPRGQNGINPLIVKRGYRDRVVQVRMGMYVDDSEVMFTTFNVTGNNNRASWMQQRHIISSSYEDIKTTRNQQGFFSIHGYDDGAGVIRRFYAFKSHDGCNRDYNWFVIKHGVISGCTWAAGDYPVLLYCKQKTVCNAKSLHRAERFVVSVKMG